MSMLGARQAAGTLLHLLLYTTACAVMLLHDMLCCYVMPAGGTRSACWPTPRWLVEC
jgi:hypothetical protein